MHLKASNARTAEPAPRIIHSFFNEVQIKFTDTYILTHICTHIHTDFLIIFKIIIYVLKMYELVRLPVT